MFPLGEFTKSESERWRAGLVCAFPKSRRAWTCALSLTAIIATLYGGTFRPRSSGQHRRHTGKILAKHNGIALYTIGQRKGLKCGGRAVVRVGIGRGEECGRRGSRRGARKRELVADRVNWIAGEQPELPRATCKIRYRAASRRPPYLPARK
jgi:tRNA-specific 2-thiouridylase